MFLHIYILYMNKYKEYQNLVFPLTGMYHEVSGPKLILTCLI